MLTLYYKRMQFVRYNSILQVSNLLATFLQNQLAQQKQVLWLVAGGSCIPVATSAAQQLSAKTNNLHITITDERFGKAKHPDSNWRQLLQNGFTVPNAQFYPVITTSDVSSSTSNYANTLTKLFHMCPVRIGLFGIGTDGHTAGILPNSQATKQSNKLATWFDTPPYTRITTTSAAIKQLTHAFVFTQGKEKWPVLDQLEDDLPIAIQPAQILKKVPYLTIYNDYKGDLL